MSRDPDPLGSFWYVDSVSIWRCKICLHAKTERHGATCSLGQVQAFVAALAESDLLDADDLACVEALADLVGVSLAVE